MSFTFSRLRLMFKVSHGIMAPFTLYLFAPALEQRMRQTVGCSSFSCDDCQKSAECAVSLLFSKRLSTDPAALKRFQKPSVPVVIRPPVLTSHLQPGDEFSIDVTMVGKAITHAGAIVDAMAVIAASGLASSKERASLISVSTIGHQGVVTHVTDDAIRRKAIPLPLLSLDFNSGQHQLLGVDIELLFDTPLRLVDAGHVARSFSFGLFFRTLMRRLSALSYYYCDYELPLDCRLLSGLAGQTNVISSDICFKEIPGRKGQGGLVGRVLISVQLEELVALLVAGSYFNVGKGAHAGFGQFRVGRPGNP